MRTYRLLGVAATLAVVSFTIVPSIASSGSGAGSAGAYAPVCLPAAASGVANCDAIQLLNPGVNWHGTHVPVGNNGKGSGKGPGGGGGGGGGTPSGYQPADLQLAYGLTSDSANYGKGQTVAIVDAYNDPNALQDVNMYRSHWHIPPFVTGQFQQVSQTGTTVLPKNSSSWSEEISLDLDMVSAICPNCNILLVEANSASIADLSAAAYYAGQIANVVSNSYGANEFLGETKYDRYYSRQGVAFTASAGDSGYGVEYPAASPNVTAVGGTTLTQTNSGWSQTVWSGTGSGCSAYEQKPLWQESTLLCSMRTVADTAAVADPNTGVAVYDSFHEPGWMVFGGTSVASPLIASIYALANDLLGGSSPVTAQNLYLDSATLNHVTSGSNLPGCTNYLCSALANLQYTYDTSSVTYNGPTGVGTPIGLNGF